MTWLEAGLWGLTGGACMEFIDLYKLVRTADGSYCLPVGGRQFWLGYALAVTIRLLLGFFTAWALYDADKVSDYVTALFVGAGATGFLEHAVRSPRPPGGGEEGGSS